MKDISYINIIMESLLKEEAVQSSVIDAIKKRYEVGVIYKADNDAKGSGYRVIQPVAYGKTSAGNLVVRAFQPYGDTKTKTSGWKLFRLDKIEKWKPLRKRKFSEPPAAQFGEHGKFNPNGDGSMAEVYLVANFNGAKNDNIARFNQKRHDQMVAANPYYDFERNIDKAVDATQIDYIRRNIEDWQRSRAAREFHKGNNSSLYDMQQITDFGDSEESQTVGPVRKGNTETEPQDNDRVLDYSGAMNNGPIYKQQLRQQTVPVDKYEDEDDPTDNEEDEENNI